MGHFSDLLTQFRERNNLKKGDLANAIQKTEGYIRKLELYNTTPPTYNTCKSIISALKLSREEEYLFLKTAFFERIKKDLSYYYLIEKTELLLLKEKEESAKKSEILFEDSADNLPNCTYELKLKETNKIKRIQTRNKQ